MPSKKPRSAKQLANDQRLRDEAEQRRVANEAAKAIAEQPAQEESEPSLSDLIKQVQELKQQLSWQQPQNQPQGPQINAQGRLQGRVDKYNVDPARYPDPSEKLAQEPRLQRFAFPINYELKYVVTTTSYQTQDGVNMREPKFSLDLNYILRDEDTGEPTNTRITLKSLAFHEDPQAAIEIAREQGLEVADINELAFLNEMRYLRMRDWLIEAFYPPKGTSSTPQRKEMVFGNKVVPFFEISSENPSAIPFNQLDKKL